MLQIFIFSLISLFMSFVSITVAVSTGVQLANGIEFTTFLFNFITWLCYLAISIAAAAGATSSVLNYKQPMASKK